MGPCGCANVVMSSGVDVMMQTGDGRAGVASVVAWKRMGDKNA